MPDGTASAHRYLPKLVTTLAAGYGLGTLRRDAMAGLTVAILALPLSMAIAVASGLFLGKAVGIFGASWLTVKLGWATRPAGVTWPILAGAVVGIGSGWLVPMALHGLPGRLLDVAS